MTRLELFAKLMRELPASVPMPSVYEDDGEISVNFYHRNDDPYEDVLLSSATIMHGGVIYWDDWTTDETQADTDTAPLVAALRRVFSPKETNETY